jgi:hypothetical protein
MKDFIITRLREPSTYAGIAALVGSLTFIPNAAEWGQVVIAAGTAIAGALAILLGEKAK